MNDRTLLAELKPLLRALEADLKVVFDKDEHYRRRLSEQWQQAQENNRTAEALDVWVGNYLTQSAVAWLLACVFVRFCEDNELLEERLIAGIDGRGRSAQERQQAFYTDHPTASDNAYLREVFATAGKLPGLAEVFRVQAELLTAPVSVDCAKQLVRFFRETDPDTGKLRRDFNKPHWDTHFLGDLYQDLSEDARKRYALLQTPKFVEAFILDRTLTPALDSYALEEVDVIDPACGSGHFLLGAFERLAPLWLERHPKEPNIALPAALDRIAGMDVNPFAVAITRFRLLIAALQWVNVRKLQNAPLFHFHIEVGDSLLHGFDQRDDRKGQAILGLNSPQENLERGDHLYRHAYATEDLEAAQKILAHKYTVVVGNPPYITVKDAAISELYRKRFESCHRQYALVAPFCERFWALAKPLDQTQRAGFVGLIVANSFMKREFGKKLVEAFFPRVDLTHVIDTSGAYIPGHGTPTVILFGRNRPPSSSVVRAVMGIKGEPTTPADPAQGIVWQAILRQIDQRDSESEWVSVADVSRDAFTSHPWSMGGGGAASLVEQIELNKQAVCDEVSEIGYSGQTNADGVFLASLDSFKRYGVEDAYIKRLIVGDAVRDWLLENTAEYSLFPYSDTGLVHISVMQGAYRWVWPYRTTLGNRATFSGSTYFNEGRSWWEWHQIALRRFNPPFSITFADIATHNHFVLDRGGKVFNRTAPVIKLSASSTEDDHLSLLGFLNSSTACFWLKQVCHNKGSTVDQQGARQRTAAFEDFYAFNATKISQFPIAEQRPLALARKLDDLARQRTAYLPAALFAQTVPTRAELDAARATAESLRAHMIANQEELDWQVYPFYGVWDETLCYADEPPEIRFGERAFEIVLAQDCAAGKTTTTWFERHGAQPVTALPAHWPPAYQTLVEQRIDAIRRSRDLALIERPECKRRWSQPDWTTLERAALENWLLDRLEAADLWPRDPQPAPQLRSARELADQLAGDDAFRRALDLYAGSGSEAHPIVATLARQASVPHLDALRYTDSGLRKRAIWRQVWDLQRREDAIDAEVANILADQPPAKIKEAQTARKKADIGLIPVPPKYKPDDFQEGGYWKLRGALDVPKERFMRFPGLERANDPTSPMLLWAGYDAKQRALALAGALYDLQQREGYDAARFTPALAGLDEGLPWVRQWHPAIDPDLGISTADYLQGLLDAQLAQYGLTLADLRHWRPPAPVRRPRGKSAKR
jgi:hypothetical protein